MKIISLAHELTANSPHGPVSPGFSQTLQFPHAPFLETDRHNLAAITSGSDQIAMGTHTGTHVDSLAHIAEAGTFFDGTKLSEAQTGSFIELKTKAALEPIYCRAALIDLPNYLGVSQIPGQTIIDSHLVHAAAKYQNIELRQSHAILVRTGRDEIATDSDQYMKLPIPGVNVELARMMVELKAPIVGTDTMPFEAAPPAENELPLEVHAILIARAGIPILENLDLRELSSERIYEFDLVIAPLPIRGGTGSPVNPLAIMLD